MPSLADIPERLLIPWKRLEFIAWLAACPIADNTKRALGHMWSKHTGRRLSKEHWTIIMASE